MQENDRKQAKINSQNHMFCIVNKLEAQLAKPESPTCYFVLRKLYTEHSIGASTKFRCICLLSFIEDYLEIDQ
jgi:hypothetical protein